MEAQTGETPKTLLDKPRLLPWLTWLYESFWIIDASRPIYQGSVGRITLGEMAAYIGVFELVETEAKQSFVRTMRALDSVYVKLVNEQIARKIEAARKDAERGRERGR